MSILKRNIIIFCFLDIAYLILSGNIILSYFIPESADWYGFIPFIIIITLGGYGLFIYRRPSKAILPITKWQYTWTRVLTFTFLAVYVVQMIILPDLSEYPVQLSIIVGGFLGAIGLASLILHSTILMRGHRK